MAAYGLYSHIQSNRRRSIALLIGLFLLVYVLVYAGALVGEALTINADLDILMQRAWRDLFSAAPLATIGTALWIVLFRAPRRGPTDFNHVHGQRTPARHQPSRHTCRTACRDGGVAC